MMDIDEDFPAAAPAEKTTTNVAKGEFDLESYISNYTGHTKIDRLIFIAEHCKELELESYKMAIDELKKTTNTVGKCKSVNIAIIICSSYQIAIDNYNLFLHLLLFLW